jgi:NADH dehydrogenase
MSEKSSAHALESLNKMGVNTSLNTRIVEYTGRKAITKDGRELHGSILIWAAGVKAVIPAGIDPICIEGGRISVDEYSRIKGLEREFAIGDVARMSTTEYPEGHPMMAQPAIQQGELLARNLILLGQGKSLHPFRYKNLGAMATIGRSQAVTELPRIRLYGWFAWITWLLVHIYQLIGFRNKVVVMIHWAQNYFRHSRDLRLIIRPFRSKY